MLQTHAVCRKAEASRRALFGNQGEFVQLVNNVPKVAHFDSSWRAASLLQ